MEHQNNHELSKFLFRFVKTLIIFIGLFTMYFAAHFWIGTQEDWREAIETNLLQFFLSRLFLTLIVGGIFFSISTFIEKMYSRFNKSSKPTLRKKIGIEFLCMLALAFIFAAMAVF